MAMKKCPNGMYAEIKYDGERVQVHKQGGRFEFFSRSLKAVQAHKVSGREGGREGELWNAPFLCLLVAFGIIMMKLSIVFTV